jgi:hypothetical protein
MEHRTAACLNGLAIAQVIRSIRTSAPGLMRRGRAGRCFVGTITTSYVSGADQRFC